MAFLKLEMEYIAEIGSGHRGSLIKAKELVAAAKESGADTVKFQWIIAEEIVPSRVGMSHFSYADFDLYKSFKECEKGPDFYFEIQELAQKLELGFLCSVFGLESLSLYLQLNPDAIKIASPEINHYPLLTALAALPIPVLLSTGLASLLDLHSCVELLNPKSKLYLLHCVTEYPAACAQYQLAFLPLYQQLFTAVPGISDHSSSCSLLPATAVFYGSEITEKHFTLDKQGKGLDDPIALDPEEFTAMREATETATKLLRRDSDEYWKFLGELHRESELPLEITAQSWESPPLRDIYESSRRSLFCSKKVSAGEKISSRELSPLRSEKNLSPGIPAQYLAYLETLKSRNSIEDGFPIRFSQVDL